MVTLGTSYKYKMSGAKRSLVEKAVPLLENLQWLLQNREIYQEVQL